MEFNKDGFWTDSENFTDDKICFNVHYNCQRSDEFSDMIMESFLPLYETLTTAGLKIPRRVTVFMFKIGDNEKFRIFFLCGNKAFSAVPDHNSLLNFINDYNLLLDLPGTGLDLCAIEPAPEFKLINMFECWEGVDDEDGGYRKIDKAYKLLVDDINLNLSDVDKLFKSRTSKRGKINILDTDLKKIDYSTEIENTVFKPLSNIDILGIFEEFFYSDKMSNLYDPIAINSGMFSKVNNAKKKKALELIRGKKYEFRACNFVYSELPFDVVRELENLLFQPEIELTHNIDLGPKFGSYKVKKKIDEPFVNFDLRNVFRAFFASANNSYYGGITTGLIITVSTIEIDP